MQADGYSSEQTDIIRYDDDWEILPYFLSSREIALEMSILSQLDAKILIGQLSYKQRADIYNYTHKYEQQRSTAMMDVDGKDDCDLEEASSRYNLDSHT